MRGHKITGFETGGDDWRFGAILSHAVFDTVEKTVDNLKAKPAKKVKLEQRQDPATTVKSEASQDPAKTKSEANPASAVKTEPRERSGKKVNKARDRPIKAEDRLVDLVSEEEQVGEYIEEDEWI